MAISPALFEFLSDLKDNNNRDWFKKNKDRYDKVVKEPLLAFIADFGEQVPVISPHIIAVPRVNGGSMFRIYRDVRFSKDKTPYKTAAAVQFRHERGKDVHAPGYYLHLEPDSVYAGCGIWKPDSETVYKIRSRIINHPDEWKKSSRKPPFIDAFTLGGDSLKRPPRGFDPEHPLIEDLKMKDYIGSVELNEKIVCQNDFVDYYIDLCKKAAPFMEFLTGSLGLAW